MAATTIDENTKFPLRLNIILWGLIATLAGTAAVTKFKVDHQDDRINALERQRQNDLEAATKKAAETQKLADDVAYTKEAVTEIKRKLDDMMPVAVQRR